MGFTREWFLAVKIICIRYTLIQETQENLFAIAPLRREGALSVNT